MRNAHGTLCAATDSARGAGRQVMRTPDVIAAGLCDWKGLDPQGRARNSASVSVPGENA